MIAFISFFLYFVADRLPLLLFHLSLMYRAQLIHDPHSYILLPYIRLLCFYLRVRSDFLSLQSDRFLDCKKLLHSLPVFPFGLRRHYPWLRFCPAPLTSQFLLFRFYLFYPVHFYNTKTICLTLVRYRPAWLWHYRRILPSFFH